MPHPLVSAAEKLRAALRPLTFPAPVTHTYLPLDYAWEPHKTYLERFGTSPKKILFLGMNPGPYGMAQTGIPFGEIPAVRDWLGITGPVGKPSLEHPKRPVEGFACQRSEVSGRRLWGLFADNFPDAETFFRDHFVLNFCPLVWMKDTGANLTPDKLPREAIEPVEELCRRHLDEVIAILRPTHLIGIGAFAEKQLRLAAPDQTGTTARILHPSPASPAANRDFPGTALKQLKTLGLW